MTACSSKNEPIKTHTKHTTLSAITPALRSFIAVVMVLSFVVYFAPQPHTAYGLTVEKTTAKPNQSDSKLVFGGVPTRITWEATVDDAEEVQQITLTFPEGTSLGDEANTKVTILDGTDRRETPCKTSISAQGTVIEFEEPVESNLRIRVEMHYVALPVEEGNYVLTGSYVDSTGAEIPLEDSPSIAVASLTTVERITQWLDEQGWVEAWNSVRFLYVFFNPQVIVTSIPILFIGWLRSLGLVLVGFPLAIPLGLFMSFLRMSKFRLVRFIASIYVNVIRGTPLFLQIYIAFFGLPLLGFKIDSYVMGVLVLAMNSSAYMAEIFRAGIQSIHKGQFEASASLGMNGAQTMFSVIIPQTVRRIIPTATSEFILLYKDTSLLAAVGVMEQMMFAKSVVASTGNMTPYVVAAGYYLIITLPLTKIIGSFERKLASADGSSAASVEEKDKKSRRKKKKEEATAAAVLGIEVNGALKGSALADVAVTDARSAKGDGADQESAVSDSELWGATRAPQQDILGEDDSELLGTALVYKSDALGEDESELIGSAFVHEQDQIEPAEQDGMGKNDD